MSESNGNWILKESETKHEFMCLAADPHHLGRFYAGTFDNGLWVSDDYGKSWNADETGISERRILSVAVSETEVIDDYGVVWIGTEPSRLYRSADGGNIWIDFPSLLDLPSRSTWRFPPRPYTHHISSIQPDLHDSERIFVGIELGGVMRSINKGKTWEDRKGNSQFDCHTLTMNQLAKNRIYEAAGSGFAESLDGGATWQTINDGLGDYTYLVDIATDPVNPNTIIASAAKSARSAYRVQTAETVIVRKEINHPWQIVSEGLPERKGATIFALTTNETEPGVFYAVNNQGVFRSADTGKTWESLIEAWPDQLKGKRVRALLATF